MELPTKISETEKTTSIKDAIHGISKYLELFAIELEKQWQNNDYDSLIKSISISLDSFSDTLINFGCNPDYIDSYKRWGDYGWAINPQIGHRFFLIEPNSLENANAQIQFFCNIDSITEINNSISTHGLNSDDLADALLCYKNNQYKPCAMILFSLLDCCLINLNCIGKDKNGKPFIKTGLGAICELKDNGEKFFTENDFLIFLQFKLIIHCLMVLFQNANNFENEPQIINRNFLMHGKRTKPVTDIDCYKLWTALYSLVVVYPELKEQVRKNLMD